VRRDISRLITTEVDRVGHLSARLATLGPSATLARGYAVVQAGKHILRSVADAPAGTELRIRVADGALAAVSRGESDA
jgi:exodeoxyribonuclease VII large subunit